MKGQEPLPDFLIFLLVGTFILLLLCGAVIFFVLLYQRRVLQNKLDIQNLQTDHQKTLLRATIDSEEKERNRMGSELHDSVGAMLSAIKLNMKMMGMDPSGFKKSSEEITKYLDETIENVRNISHDLYPAGLKKFGMSGVLKEHVEKFQKNKELDVRLDSQGNVKRMSPRRELMIFRIVQELLHNAIKHSRGSTISIYLNWTSEKLIICVKDNGVGFSTNQLKEGKKGIGLYNITNRAEVINANVLFKNSERGGANIDLHIPYQTVEIANEKES